MKHIEYLVCAPDFKELGNIVGISQEQMPEVNKILLLERKTLILEISFSWDIAFVGNTYPKL